MISIFKTNIENEYQVQQIKHELDLLIDEIKWNFDLEDCDKILRVESKQNISSIIISLFSTKGYHCIELF